MPGPVCLRMKFSSLNAALEVVPSPPGSSSGWSNVHSPPDPSWFYSKRPHEAQLCEQVCSTEAHRSVAWVRRVVVAHHKVSRLAKAISHDTMEGTETPPMWLLVFFLGLCTRKGALNRLLTSGHSGVACPRQHSWSHLCTAAGSSRTSWAPHQLGATGGESERQPAFRYERSESRY